MKTVRRLLIIYKNKLRILIRKRFSNWKLKTFTASYYKDAEKNVENINNANNSYHLINLNNEIKEKHEKDFIDYHNYSNNNNEKENDYFNKNYNHPFSAAVQSKMKHNDNKSFSREESNKEFESKNNETNQKTDYLNINLPNGNKNKIYSANKSFEKNDKNENEDKVFKKQPLTTNKESITNSKIKYNSNYELNVNNNYGHANTTRNRDNSANKQNKNSNKKNNQYSSLFGKNISRDISSDKIRSPQKIYEKLHEVLLMLYQYNKCSIAKLINKNNQ